MEIADETIFVIEGKAVSKEFIDAERCEIDLIRFKPCFDEQFFILRKNLATDEGDQHGNLPGFPFLHLLEIEMGVVDIKGKVLFQFPAEDRKSVV